MASNGINSLDTKMFIVLGVIFGIALVLVSYIIIKKYR